MTPDRINELRRIAATPCLITNCLPYQDALREALEALVEEHRARAAQTHDGLSARTLQKQIHNQLDAFGVARTSSAGIAFDVEERIARLAAREDFRASEEVKHWQSIARQYVEERDRAIIAAANLRTLLEQREREAVSLRRSRE